MNPEIQSLFDRQARWQRNRRSLSYGDKLRQSVAMRSAVRALRRDVPEPPPTAGPEKRASA